MKIVDELRKENYEYVNNTNEAIDILVSITGCAGENSTNYHENTWDSNNYWYEGARGSSVRIYTTRLNIDMIILGGAGSAQTKRRDGWDDVHDIFWEQWKTFTPDWDAKRRIDQSREWVEDVWENRSWDRRRGRWWIEYRARIHSWRWGDVINQNKPVDQGQSRAFVTTLRPTESIKVDFLDNGAKTGYQLSIYSLESNGGVPFDDELLKVFEKPKGETPATNATTESATQSPQVDNPTESPTQTEQNPTQG
ncbi:hypothetical protein [Helicobacter suis]|uniref:hypothetical protein n=1 Tax=Helicobacter suis TaxID=104628 RepID=UPI0013D6B6E5|nr:hypothetical protein [Helicobacter suis]